MLSETASALSRKSARKACSMMTATFLVGRRWKRCFWHYSERKDAGNAVSGITPNGKTLETLFLALLRTERRWKRCFWHYSEREDAGNTVSCITPNGKVLETLFLRSIQREWERKRCDWPVPAEYINGNNVVVTKQSVSTTNFATASAP